MRKLVLLLILSIPLVALGQDYRRVSVYDESGNDLGTYMIQSDYTSSVNMAIHVVSKRFLICKLHSY